MAFYPEQNIFQPSSGSETYTISTTQNNTQYQKTMSECIDLIRTKVPGANLIILRRNSGATAYYIGGAVISENTFYIGDTAEYPGNTAHHVYFGNGSNTGTIQIQFFTVYYGTGARLDDNPMDTKTYQTMQVGEIGTCFYTDIGGNDLGNVVYVSGGYSQLVINEGPPILYQWSSVPAISGKNGILSLTTLKEESINDGSPVDDATASAFNNAPNSCSVGGIISKDLPIINDNPLSIAVKYNIPELTDSVYSSCKVVAKKNKIPKSKTDGDKILDVSPSSHGCVINGLDQNTKYYVVVFVEDNLNNKAESDPADCTTGRNEEYNFAYTGSIQTFTAPKTGIYQLETWGAQGGNASDDNLVARGGYGAYAKGEVLLTQGETIYINVGGQNGYGGGGLKIWDGSEIAIIWSGENNKLTAQINNNSILFKMYSGNTVIYSFTSQTGTSVSDISKINAGFLIDTEREVAKPSFIYDIGSSSYKYNSETPTDAEMADIYTWLQAGL